MVLVSFSGSEIYGVVGVKAPPESLLMHVSEVSLY